TLGLANDFLVLGVRGYAAFDSWHGNLLGGRLFEAAMIRNVPGSLVPGTCALGVRQHRAHVLLVGGMHFRRTAQMPLVLRGLLRQDVALEGLRALDASAGADLEALGRASLGFHLGHC